MKLTRLPDWPERLAAEIEAASGRTFSWGEWDCGHFAVACCIAVTGVDVGAPWRGSYDSEIGLARLYVSLGCRSVDEWADIAIGVRRDLKLARRGDWVLSPEGEPEALGVCMGARSLFLTPSGMTIRRTLSCRAAWEVGE